MTEQLRRVVTAQTPEGGRITADQPVTPEALGAVTVHEIWRDPPPEPGAAWSLEPPPGGSRFGIATFPPAAPGEPPFEHATETIDYGVILEGEIVLWTDTGETVLSAGDVFVQRGANHAWINRGTKPCRMAVTLIAKPAP